MPPAPPSPEDDTRLSGARAEFAGSLPRRLEALRSALRAVEEEPDDPDRLNGLLRRVHALASAARVLGFASAAEALAEAERGVRKSAGSAEGVSFHEFGRALDLLPSLVLGAPVQPRSPESAEALPEGWPVSVLVLGPAVLAQALIAGQGNATLECERAGEAERALELARIMGPDVVVVDGDDPGARAFVTALGADALIEPVPIVVVGSFEHPESTAVFVELGAARVLPKPCSPDTLRRTVEEVRDHGVEPRAVREPLGELSVAALAERIGAEFKRGLVDALESGSPRAAVALGDGHDVLAAVWGAVARVRELVTLRSNGTLRFEASGPEGAVPLAPWGLEERRAGERGPERPRQASGVSLQGRRILVADDDPAVVWFMSGLLKAVGVEVLEAHDGQRALELAFEQWPHVVISDVLMPKLDGFSLCHELKRDVAVRDVPVILLSWKEDLLQRVRELGADADGYLRKEAAASAVVERVREVLRARARVEERIASGGEVRGRLDGLTPRLVLELACQGGRDVRVSVRDAAFLFETQIRRGRLVAVTRSAPDGSFARGPDVLPSLLGAGAGRFVVETDSSPCRTELHGTLAELLREPLERARAALRAVAAGRLVRLRRLELDGALVEAYLSSTPEPAASALRRVMNGASVPELVQSGEVSPRLLEVMLSDIARRGGIRVAELAPASSLPPREPAAAREAEHGAAPAAAQVNSPEPPAAPGTESTFAAVPSDVRPFDTTRSEEDETGWFAEAVEATPFLPDASGGTEPLPAVSSSNAAENAPVASGAEALRVEGALAAPPLDTNLTPATDWTSGPLFGFGPPPETDPAPTLAGIGAPAEPATRDEPRELNEADLTAAPPSPAQHAPEPAPETPAAAPAPGVASAPEPTPAAAVASAPAPEAPAPTAASDSPSEAVALPDAFPDADDEHTDVLDKVSVVPRHQSSRPPRLAKISRPSRASRASSGRSISEPAGPLNVPVEPSRLPTMPPQRGRGRDASGWASVVFRTILAGAIAFGFTTWIILPLVSDDEPPPDEEPSINVPPTPAAPPAPAASSPPPAPWLVTEELDVPSGVELPAQHGLLEIETESSESIYVDGALVGRGPVRRVPSPPGRYRVEVRGESATSETEVTVVAGKRSRVRSTALAAPASSAGR